MSNQDNSPPENAMLQILELRSRLTKVDSGSPEFKAICLAVRTLNAECELDTMIGRVVRLERANKRLLRALREVVEVYWNPENLKGRSAAEAARIQGELRRHVETMLVEYSYEPQS